MEKLSKGIGLALVTVLLILASAQARTAYVSDMLILTFREGPGTTYPVLKTLKSNTVLNVLEEEEGYFKVELTSGEQGWVDKQFVIFEPPKALELEQLVKEKDALETRLAEMEATSGQLRVALDSRTGETAQELSTLKEQADTLMQENKRLSRELEKSQKAFAALEAASKDVVATLDTNRALTAENKQLSQALEQSETQNSRLFKTGMIKWFLAGVGVLLMGWLFGVMLSSKRRRRGSLLD